MSEMVSVRLPADLASAVKANATKEGETVSSWIRRVISSVAAPPLPEPEIMEMMACDDGPPIRLPAEAVREIVARLMPVLWEHGSVSLTFGRPQIQNPGPALMTTSVPTSVTADRPQTFSCPHMTAGNVISMSCDLCVQHDRIS